MFLKEKPKAVASVPPALASVRFRLNSLEIKGLTAYPKEFFTSYYAGQLGKTITVPELYVIMTRIQQRYLDDGFTFAKVSLPSQDLQAGNIVFTVVEGYVGTVEFEKPPPASPVIDDAIARIKAMRPLNTYTLERLVLILNDMPGPRLGVVLAPPVAADSPPGALRLIFRQLPDPAGAVHGLVTIDNNGSRFVGPYRLGLQGVIAHAGAAYNQLQYQFEIAKPVSELAYAGLNYTLPLFGASGAKLALLGTVSRSDPGSTLEDLDVAGRTNGAMATLSYPVIRTRDQTLNTNLAFEINNAKTDLLSERLYDDRLRSLRADANYTFSDRYYGLNDISAGISQGLNILGVRKTGSSDLSRADGRTDYRKVNAAIARYQNLPANVGLYGRLQGQYTNDPLLSAEEFGFGGEVLGRGYDPSEIVGDKGVSLSLELSKAYAYESWRLRLQPYLFYDMGKVWNIDPGASDAMSAASTGFGLHMSFQELWSCNATLAFR